MGHGHFDDDNYRISSAQRKAANIDDFEYTKRATSIHPTLDPKRIPTKPFQLLESRDSVDHPISTPIIVTFDVTGSNERNAKVAQRKLPELMAKLAAVCENPQVAIWANDDVKVEGTNAIQLGEFESNNLIDETIRNIWITSDGGGNGGESYDLLVYAASRKTVTDSMEKRGKRGIMVLYADEHVFPQVKAREVRMIFDDKLEADIPIEAMFAEAKQKWDIFFLWPTNGYPEARAQYVQLVGDDHVENLESAEMLCDKVAAIVARCEQAMQDNATAALAEEGELQGREV